MLWVMMMNSRETRMPSWISQTGRIPTFATCCERRSECWHVSYRASFKVESMRVEQINFLIRKVNNRRSIVLMIVPRYLNIDLCE